MKVEADDLLTAKEARQVLGIQHRSVLKAISRGRLKARRVGFLYYITRQDVEQYRKETQ